MRNACHLPSILGRRSGRPKQLTDSGDMSGFTLVESLIVLAIAGIILLIVFAAIPTLERNSRNNQRRQDVQATLASVSKWELNNSGNIPTTVQLDGFLQQYQKMSYYLPANVTINASLNAVDAITIVPRNTAIDIVRIYNHAKCTANSGGTATNAGAGYSDIVALYAIETSNSGAVSSQCQEL
jgi:prepilin-type N-terminal cleavage/methylation domain-containing protein